MNRDAQRIMNAAIASAMPDEAVRQALGGIRFDPEGRVVVVAIGKAAWAMAAAARDALAGRAERGVVITKYGHSKGLLEPFEIYEAGHPVPDGNTYSATTRALQAVDGLTGKDTVLFLVSGGGSALFEQPLIPPDELADITGQLLKSGAGITEINTIRKRLSAVKGGRFAVRCAPAHVCTVILSDVLGDPPDMIASGPACPDPSTCAQAEEIAARYGIRLSPVAQTLIRTETPKKLDRADTFITGSVKQLCRAAAEECVRLGYEPVFLTSSLNCEAREAGAFLAAIARDHQHADRSLAFLAGGETVVHVTGGGLGGRNQEIALSAAAGIAGCRDTCVFSFGSDGTDGPTDAAGGYADGETAARLKEAGTDLRQALADNDAYHALQTVGGLIVTGPTGTNVNDLSAVLIRR